MKTVCQISCLISYVIVIHVFKIYENGKVVPMFYITKTDSEKWVI